MDTEKGTMSLKSKREYLGRIYGRYQRAGREHKGKILDEFCAVLWLSTQVCLATAQPAIATQMATAGPKAQV